MIVSFVDSVKVVLYAGCMHTLLLYIVHVCSMRPPPTPPVVSPAPSAMDPQQRQFFTLENLLAAVSALGIDPEGFFLDSEFRGGQCHIFKLSRLVNARGDLEDLAVRAPVYMEGHDAKVWGLRKELDTLQTLGEKGFPWAPRCLGSSLSFDNAVRHPFVVLTWIDGTALCWDENVPVRAVRDKVLAQMTAIQVSLIECTQKSGVFSIFIFLGTKNEMAY